MSLLLTLVYLSYQSSLASSTPISFLSSASDSSPTPLSNVVDPNPLARLIWGCVATVFASSWVAVHPNVPAPDAGWVRRAAVRAEFMLWTIVAPEVIVVLAVQQWFAARGLADIYRDKGWTITHGFFLQMGGLTLMDGGVSKGVISPSCFQQLLLKAKIAFPDLPLRKIEARCHSGNFPRGAAVLQVVWFVSQFASKIHSKGALGVSQLELATLAITILNVFIVVFWWFKPHNVRVPIKVHLLHATPVQVPSSVKEVEASSDEMYSLRLGSSSKMSEIKSEKDNSIVGAQIVVPQDRPIFEKVWFSYTSEPLRNRLIVFIGFPDYRIADRANVPIFFASELSRRKLVFSFMITTLLGMLFGAIHCAGWNLSFPSSTEALLWKIASAMMVGYLGVFLVILLPQVLFKEMCSDEEEPAVWAQWFEGVVLWGICAPIYVAARVFVLVEVFLALRTVGPDVGEAIWWTTFLPHV